MVVIIGSASVPITDLSGNTFPADKYICEVIGASKNYPVINVQDGVWWIHNSEWGSWQNHMIKITPIEYYNVISVLTNNSNTEGKNWATSNHYYRVFQNPGGYYVIDSTNTVKQVEVKKPK